MFCMPMKPRALIAAVFISAIVVAPSMVLAQNADARGCGMGRGTFSTSSSNHSKINILVEDPTASAAIFVVANKLAVNTDGSPRSYHLSDPKGERFALNNLCNAVVKAYDNGSQVACGRRYYDIVGRLVREQNGFGLPSTGYDPKQDADYKLGGDFGLDLDEPEFPLPARAPTYKFPITASPRAAGRSQVCYSCTSGDCKVCFDPDIIKTSGDKACMRDKGKYAGYLANLTSIDPFASNKPDPENDDGANADDGCRHELRIDAEKLPGFVLPRGALGADGRAQKARIGDIAILYNVHTAKWAFAVVNDAGPAKDFGEGSLALNRILRVGYKATPARPINYSQTKALHIANRVAVLLFPGTKAGFGGDYAPISVAKAAKKAFEEWGGGDLAKARQRFRECLTVLPESFKGQY
jgi:Fungal chitosanase of glycosyl hydrolase group 75